MAYYKSITIEIPDVEEMPDEVLACLLDENDGRWSAQTKALLEQFKTSRLDLNLNWAKTWVGWQCPCCKREKPSLARLSRSGVLRCKLERHHDHLEDYTRRLFNDVNPPVLGDAEYNRQRDIAKDAIIALAARFDPVLVCSDCNAAEGEAKKKVLGVGKNFTFSPKEITVFISPTSNNTHEVDFTSAQQTWEAAKADFEDRIDFAQRMARRFAKDKNRKQIVVVRRDLSFEDSQYFAALVASRSEHLGGSLSSQIEKRSVAYDGDGRFSVGKPKQASRSPTDAEFELLERRLFVGKDYWIGVGEQWTCGCCGRNKREICRISNRGEWTARIHKIRDWEYETNSLCLNWRQRDASSTLVLRAHRTVYVCQDCRNVVTNLQRLHPGVSENAFTPHTLSDVLVTTDANADHLADYDRALRIANANRELVLAVEDYERHKQLSLDIKYRFKRETEYRKKSAKQALGAVADGLFEDELKSAYNSVAYTRWLVDEGLRFQQLIETEKAKVA